MLAVPLAALFIGVVVWSVRSGISIGASDFSNFILASVFFSNIHLGLTYSALFTLPEFRGYIREGPGIRTFWAQTAGVFLLSVGLVGATYIFMPASVSVHRLLLAAMAVISVHHLLTQTYGISRLYSLQAVGRHGKPELERLLFWERKIHRSVVYLMLVWVVGMTIKSEFNVPHAFFLGLNGLVCAGVAALLWIAAKLAKAGVKNKFVFSLRLLAYPFAVVLDERIGSLLIYSAHGSEYIHLFSGIRRKTSAAPSQIKSYEVLAAIFMALAFVLLLGRSNGFTFSIERIRASNDLWMNVLVVLSYALTFTHVYLDRRLFNWREPAVVRNIGKLFRSN